MARNKKIKLTVSEEEFRKISEGANRVGLPIAALVRSAALGHKIPKPRLDIDRHAVVALNRIGSNLNQIARIANQDHCLTPNQVQALGNVLQFVRETTEAIKEGIR